MKQTICYLINSSICCLITTLGWAQPGQADLSKTNVSHVYDLEAPVVINSRVAMGENEAIVFLQAVNQTGSELPPLQYEVRADYQTETVLTTQSLTEDQLIKQEERVSYYRFPVPLQDNANYVFIYLTINIAGAELPLRYDISLNTDRDFPLSHLLLMRATEDIPIFENFIPQNELVRVVSISEPDSAAYAYFYDHDFELNPPPMGSTGSEVQSNLTVDSLFQFPLNSPFSFDREGLYFAQLDTTSLSGISFRVENHYYPRLVSIADVAGPLRYISTAEEIEELRNGNEPKLAMDNYWMKMTRSQSRAKIIIRDYFRQVTQANQLFTTYKEGWKTGMGMIYTLYGKPNDVYRDDDKEVWIYAADNNLVNMSFTFMKVRNIFTDQHYNLMRDEEYKRFWYRNIDLWRKGRKTL